MSEKINVNEPFIEEDNGNLKGNDSEAADRQRKNLKHLAASSDYYVWAPKVSVINKSWTVSRFALINVETNFQTYLSETYMKGETWVLDLSLLGYPANTEFYVKAVVEGDDSLGDCKLKYVPADSCACTVAEYILIGNAFNTELYYGGDCGTHW